MPCFLGSGGVLDEQLWRSEGSESNRARTLS